MRWSLLILILLVGCPGTIFEEVGTHLAAPIAVAVDPAQNRVYVVNSNNKVEFDGASLSILDISSPASPSLLNNAKNPIPLPNFSGQIYFDIPSQRAYVTNRASDDSEDKEDRLLRIDLDEPSASFGGIESFPTGENPFGIACCDSAGRGALIQGDGNYLSFNLGDPNARTTLSLEVTLNAGLFSGRSASEVALLGDQAFVTHGGGLIYVINIPELGSSSQSIDYVLTNVGVARGIATDGTNLYWVDGQVAEPQLHIVPLSSLPPVNPDTTLSETDVTTIQDSGISLGSDPNGIVLFDGRAYVTNRGSDTVSAINLTSRQVETTFTVGDEPFGLAAFTGRDGLRYLYVTNLGDNSLSVINLDAGQVVTNLTP